MKILVWGMGLLGASFALRMKSLGHTITGVVRSEKSRSTLAEKGFQNIYLSQDESLSQELLSAQALVFATPVEEIYTITQRFDFFQNYQNLTLVTDMSSTKQAIMNFMQTSPSYLPFVGAHPMAGSENSGPQFADGALFVNASVYLTPAEIFSQKNSAHYQEAIALSQDIWKAVGAQTLIVKADKHDEWLAYLSHGLHLVACACATLTKNIPEVQNLPTVPVAGSFRDMTRVAASSPDLWEGILLSNRANTVAYLDNMINLLSDWKAQLANDQLDIKRVFSDAALLREKILKKNGR